MASSMNHRRHHSEPLDILAATDCGLFLFDIDSDSERTQTWESERSEETLSLPVRHRSRRQLSFSIQGARYSDSFLMDEDEIPTRDAGLDLSFSTNTSFQELNDLSGNRTNPHSQDKMKRSSDERNRRSLSKKKKKTKRKRTREGEQSMNNNSLNFREKLERFEKGDFSEIDDGSQEEGGGIPEGQSTQAVEGFELSINPHNVDTLLISARFYNQSDVITLCKDALLHCDVENALYYMFVAQKHELVDIAPFLQDFVRANFTAIVRTHRFLGMELQQLRDFLSDDGIMVTSELDVFHAARAWIDHSKTERIKHVGEVMGCVRFYHISPDDIVQYVEPHSHYFKGPGGQEVLLGIYRYHALHGSYGDLTAYSLTLLPPRKYVPLGMDPPPIFVQSRITRSSAPSIASQRQPYPGSSASRATTAYQDRHSSHAVTADTQRYPNSSQTDAQGSVGTTDAQQHQGSSPSVAAHSRPHPSASAQSTRHPSQNAFDALDNQDSVYEICVSHEATDDTCDRTSQEVSQKNPNTTSMKSRASSRVDSVNSFPRNTSPNPHSVQVQQPTRTVDTAENFTQWDELSPECQCRCHNYQQQDECCCCITEVHMETEWTDQQWDSSGEECFEEIKRRTYVYSPSDDSDPDTCAGTSPPTLLTGPDEYTDTDDIRIPVTTASQQSSRRTSKVSQPSSQKNSSQVLDAGGRASRSTDASRVGKPDPDESFYPDDNSILAITASQQSSRRTASKESQPVLKKSSSRVVNAGGRVHPSMDASRELFDQDDIILPVIPVSRPESQSKTSQARQPIHKSFSQGPQTDEADVAARALSYGGASQQTDSQMKPQFSQKRFSYMSGPGGSSAAVQSGPKKSHESHSKSARAGRLGEEIQEDSWAIGNQMSTATVDSQGPGALISIWDSPFISDQSLGVQKSPSKQSMIGSQAPESGPSQGSAVQKKPSGSQASAPISAVQKRSSQPNTQSSQVQSRPSQASAMSSQMHKRSSQSSAVSSQGKLKPYQATAVSSHMQSRSSRVSTVSSEMQKRPSGAIAVASQVQSRSPQATAVSCQMQSRPSQVGAVSSQVQSKPSRANTVSSQMQSRPSQASAMSYLMQKKRPSQASAVSSQMQPKPSQAIAVSSQMQSRPSQLSVVSSQIQKRPSQATVVSSKMKPKPSQVSAISSQIQKRPSQATVVSSKMKSKPSQVSAISSQIQKRPSQATVVSSKMKSKPSQVNAISSQIQKKPSQASVVSSQMRSKPSQGSAMSSQMQRTRSKQTAMPSQMQEEPDRQRNAGSRMLTGRSKQSLNGSQREIASSKLKVFESTKQAVPYRPSHAKQPEGDADPGQRRNKHDKFNHADFQHPQGSTRSIVQERLQMFEPLQRQRMQQSDWKKSGISSQNVGKTNSQQKEVSNLGNHQRSLSDSALGILKTTCPRSCNCPCDLNTSLVGIAKEGQGPTREPGMSEQQLDELERRIQLRRAEISRKLAANQGLCKSCPCDPTAGQFTRSRTAVKMQYSPCRGRCTQSSSPERLKLVRPSEQRDVLQPEMDEAEQNLMESKMRRGVVFKPEDENVYHSYFRKSIEFLPSRHMQIVPSVCEQNCNKYRRPKLCSTDDHRQGKKPHKSKGCNFNNPVRQRTYGEEETLDGEGQTHGVQERSRSAGYRMNKPCSHWAVQQHVASRSPRCRSQSPARAVRFNAGKNQNAEHQDPNYNNQYKEDPDYNNQNQEDPEYNNQYKEDPDYNNQYKEDPDYNNQYKEDPYYDENHDYEQGSPGYLDGFTQDAVCIHPTTTGMAVRDHPYQAHESHHLHMEPGEAFIVVAGGLNPIMMDPELPPRMVQLYDPFNNTWCLLAKMPEARHHHGCVMLDGYLYVIGGSVVSEDDLYNMSNSTNTCYRYDFGGDFWTEIAPMRCPRMYHSVAVLEGVIYAMGGERSPVDQEMDHAFLDSCEYYNADMDEWGSIANMADCTIGAAVLGFRGKLWVMGGFLEQGDDNIVLASVECYDPRTNSWQMKKPLPSPRCHASVCEVADTLYLVGGSVVGQGTQPVTSLPDVLQYWEEKDVWVQWGFLNIPRHDAACCSIGSKLYVLGGLCSLTKDVLDDMECFDVTTSERLEDIEPLPNPALGLTCVAIKPEDFSL
ncbi:uncharacterized protein [Littorina saxatilis]|uniref:BACK domain-containing protein n=1 Tax=Littorina saxatilis TaxID=31220 RepID=A0AAN9GC84_9CAEN